MEKNCWRKVERKEAIREAKEFTLCISRKLGKLIAILFGSYARRDFNIWNDIDILVITENLPRNPLERLDLITECLRLYPRVEPIIITIEEFIKKRDRDPAIIEASQKGIMLIDTLGLSGILLKNSDT